MMRAKLTGFLDRGDTVARRYPPERHQSSGALCPRHCHLPPPTCAFAIGQIDGLIQAEPHNPYFYELKGQHCSRAASRGSHPALQRAIQACTAAGALCSQKSFA